MGVIFYGVQTLKKVLILIIASSLAGACSSPKPYKPTIIPANGGEQFITNKVGLQ
jgi:hypothetical protein